MNELTPVRGHFCPGLDRLHAAAGLGTPGIRYVRRHYCDECELTRPRCECEPGE